MVMLGHHADDADASSAEPGGDLPLQRTMRHQLASMNYKERFKAMMESDFDPGHTPTSVPAHPDRLTHRGSQSVADAWSRRRSHPLFVSCLQRPWLFLPRTVVRARK
jgi:hypothetical protein